MLYQWIISLPMMLCFFWSIFFIARLHRGSDEPRVTGTILLFYIAATILYTDHWLYFSGHQSFWGEYSYSVANLCVYAYEDHLRSAAFAPSGGGCGACFSAERALSLGR